MKTIRRNTFETNSSSTHSVTIMTSEEYDKWENEGLYWDGEKLITYDELFSIFLEIENKCRKEYLIEKEITKDDFEEWLDDNSYEYIKYDTYFDDEYLETDVTNHTTKSGDEIVIICKHGRNS